MARGFLWEDLAGEVAAEFEQVHPFVRAYDSIPYWIQHGWHIEGALGDMSGVRKSEVQRRGEKSTPSVKSLRARRRLAGECIDCGGKRDPKSSNYCTRHREADRLRAAAKRERRAA